MKKNRKLIFIITGILFLASIFISSEAAVKTPTPTIGEKPQAPEIFKIEPAWTSTADNPEEIYVHLGFGYQNGERAAYRLYKKDTAGQWVMDYDSKTETTAVSLPDRKANQIGETYYYYATAVKNGTESEPSAIMPITLVRPACYDTDRDANHATGVNYYEKGTINGNTDYCKSSEMLVEYSCGMNNMAYNNPYPCEFGCFDGACRQEPQSELNRPTIQPLPDDNDQLNDQYEPEEPEEPEEPYEPFNWNNILMFMVLGGILLVIVFLFA